MTSKKNELLCIGNAIVDIFLNVDSLFLSRHGIGEGVQHISPDKAEFVLKEIGSLSPVYCSGGGAANVAKIAAMLGVNVRFAGSAGDDRLSGIFLKELECAGVKVSLYDGEGKTGVCFISKTQHVTHVAASPRAALELPESFISDRLLWDTKVIVLDGYMLIRKGFVQNIMEKASSLGIPVAMDSSSPFIVENAAFEILHYSRNYPMFVFMNADEAVTFYYTVARKNAETRQLNDAEKEAIILQDICPMLKTVTQGDEFPVFVIKLGAGGAITVVGGKIFHKRTSHVPTDNTIGAGDSFCAAFLSAWHHGKSFEECTSFGNEVAGQILDTRENDVRKEKLKHLGKALRQSN